MTRAHIGMVAIAVAWIGGIAIVSSTWKNVRTKPERRKLRVTGSAKRRIVSDLIEWSATVEAHGADRVAAYKALRTEADQTVAYLAKQGIPAAEVMPQSATTEETFETDHVMVGKLTVEKKRKTGYDAKETILVRSRDVARIEKVSREITALLEQGVSISSGEPRYFYSGLGELKITMLAAAGKDARARAESIVSSTGGAVIRKLLAADMGIININPANSTETSEEGNNDTSSLEKDIITIVHADFEME